MQEQLDLLKELQGIDQELGDVRRQLGLLENEATELAAERARVAGMVESLDRELERLQSEHRDIERSLTIERDNVEKAESRLPAIKTQKEYVAVLKEIDTAKKVNKELQDRIKAKRDEIDALAAEKAEKDAEFAAVAARTEERDSAIAEQTRQIATNSAASELRRDALLQQLPVALRKRYQMLIERRNGIAIVAARKGNCTGCNMQLPPQLYNSLYTSKEVLTCPHCNRLLYLQLD